MTDRKPTFGGGSVPSTEDTKSLAERRSDGKELEENDEENDEEDDLRHREYRRVEGGAWSHEDDKSDDPRRIVRKVRAAKEGSKDE
jgi:hypothetical protein